MSKTDQPGAVVSSDVLGPKVQEDGPWEFGYDVTAGKAYVDSQDFHQDARLHVRGDFADTDEALAYAKEIAHRLNAAPEIARMRAALKRIARWHGEFPATGEFWDDEKTRPTSYGAAYGSNGERDYMRRVAMDALGPNARLTGPKRPPQE